MKPEIMKSYNSLDKLKQRVLQVTALAYNIISERYYFGSSILYINGGLHKNLLAQLTADNGGKTVNERDLVLLVNSLTKLGFINKGGECHSDLIYPLCKIATNSENLKSNLAIIHKIERFKTIPEFLSWRKFDIYDYRSIEHEDLRCLNLAIHINNGKIFDKAWDSEEQLKILTAYRHLLYEVDIDDEWVKSRLPIFQEIICLVKLSRDLGLNLETIPDRDYWIKFFKNLPPATEHGNFPLSSTLLNQLNITFGRLEIITQQNFINKWAQNFVTATKFILNKNSKEALKYFDTSIREFTHITRRDYWFWILDATVLYVATVIRDQKYSKIQTAVINRLEKLPHYRKLVLVLAGILAILENDLNLAKSNLKGASLFFENKGEGEEVTARFLTEYALYIWLLSLISPIEIKWDTVKHYLKLCGVFHAPMAAVIFAEIILECDPGDALANEINNNSPFKGLGIYKLINVKAEWEYTMDKLSDLLISSVSETKTEMVRDRRLAWLLDPQSLNIQVVEQILRKSGQWTTGKEVTIGRLARRSDLDFIDKHDSVAMLAIEPDPYRRNSYVWNRSRLILNLIGHPCLFDYNNPDTALELIRDMPELNVKSNSSGYQLTLSHVAKEASIYVEKISPTKYKVIDFSPQLISLSHLIGNKGISIPIAAKNRLLQMIARTSPTVRVNADIIDENLPTIPANDICHIQLTPNYGGVILNLLMRPFDHNGGYFYPAQGSSSKVMQNDDQQPARMVRDFNNEMKQVRHLMEHCPILNTAQVSQFEWVYTDLEESLELLAELDEYKSQYKLAIEWPKGETLKFKASIGAKNLKLKIKSQQEWFEYDGEVNVNNDEVLNLTVLLDLLKDNNSRFVQLDDGKFVALTENFRKQLVELKLLSEGNKLFHLRSRVLNELAEVVSETKTDKKWQEHIKSIRARHQFTPQVPSTLQAELRDYQIEGFNYLSRLTNWGIGACLADDMGLGKTIQAIGLLLEQAQHGASLVIAPTSVCFNWIEELKKFAPSLNAYSIHNENQREELIERLDNMDVLICSYHLLQQSCDTFAKKEWNLLILDEAQAIKNHTTKRFKAAQSLKAKRKVALSGTPIENHLGELWSIFRFLNPGLLGSLDDFQQKFMNPIASGSQLAKYALKNLVHPFILRRTKSEVLNELPAKIEQSIYIEPTSEEIAFYDVIRRQALNNIQNMAKEENRRFSILAEITRLRQACCHSSLIEANLNIENSKLAVFLELVQELIENRHKVLVFSQYVRYLEIIRKILKDNRINYQYIDGGTPVAERKTAVNDFQNGQGDVFLISLKAGGTGLNLTAADYVIILDPWWNPAVEDQAADRAHRMGQHRPVTVYRLVMKNTIEEKIICMHKDKRDLAGDLLSGHDVGGKLSEEDLINLMQL